MTPTELREQITNQIVEALTNQQIPFWKRPWNNDPNCGAPANIVTGKAYKGMNPLLLTLASMKHGFVSRYWATYQQWKQAGGQVKKGEKGTFIVFYKPVEHQVQRDGETKTETFFVLRYWNVFNLDQVAGEELNKFRPGQSTVSTPASIDWSAADRTITATYADIRYGGNKAFYSPTGDYIQIPARQQFPDVRDFYDTHFHELGHWSLSDSRLGKLSNSYAFEELVAELAAAFTAWQLGLPQSEDLTNHKSYLACWLKAMNDDPKWIFKAAAAANKSTDYILSFSKDVESESESECVSNAA